MDLRLTDKRAIVTGGSRGLGRAIALTLASEGSDVAIAARDREALARTADELASLTGRRVVPVPVDTRDDSAVRAMADSAIQSFGGIDVLVNAAARPMRPGVTSGLSVLDDIDLLQQLDVKVAGYLRCARAVAPYMRAQQSGRIINVSGLAARRAGSITGSARNIAIVAVTKNLADELGPHGINVTAVHPGITRTEATSALLRAEADRLSVTPAEVEEQWTSTVSIGRMVEAEEVAWVVAFLASSRSVAINGDVVACGGGDRGTIYY